VEGDQWEWKVINDFDEDALARFSQENERFAPYIESLIGNDVVKLLALDPDIQESFATNLNVIVARVSVPLREWVSRENATTRRFAVPGSLRAAYVRTPAGLAARSSWLLEVRSRGEKRTIRTLQFMFRQDGAGYILTFSTLPSLRTKYEATFRRLANSFRVG
jgi:hypothetical protein